MAVLENYMQITKIKTFKGWLYELFIEFCCAYKKYTVLYKFYLLAGCFKLKS